MNPLYIILGIAALVYVPTLISVLKLDIKVMQVLPVEITENMIRLSAGIRFGNLTSNRVQLNRLRANVKLNGRVIGAIQQNIEVPLLGNRTQIVGTEIRLTPQNLTQQLWNDAINRNLQNFVIEFDGILTANGKPYPFFTTWTIQDFVNGIGKCNS